MCRFVVMEKITAMRDDLLYSSTGDLCRTAAKPSCRIREENLEEFHPSSVSEVKEINFNSPITPHHMDPLPNWVLKQSIDLLR